MAWQGRSMGSIVSISKGGGVVLSKKGQTTFTCIEAIGMREFLRRVEAGDLNGRKDESRRFFAISAGKRRFLTNFVRL